jgi:hypothetical protein
MLKLGAQTGSMTNHLMSRAVKSEPIVGMGATILSWSDRYAATVQEVTTLKNGKILVKVTSDKAKLISGSTMTEDQEYEYTPNPEGKVYYFMKNRDEWYQVYHKCVGYNEELNAPILSNRFSKVSGGLGILFGHRESYRDPCF